MCGFDNKCNNGCNKNRHEEAIRLIEKGSARIREGLCEIKRGCIRAGICESEKGLADVLAGLRILKKDDDCETNCNRGCC